MRAFHEKIGQNTKTFPFKKVFNFENIHLQLVVFQKNVSRESVILKSVFMRRVAMTVASISLL